MHGYGLHTVSTSAYSTISLGNTAQVTSPNLSPFLHRVCTLGSSWFACPCCVTLDFPSSRGSQDGSRWQQMAEETTQTLKKIHWVADSIQFPSLAIRVKSRWNYFNVSMAKSGWQSLHIISVWARPQFLFDSAGCLFFLVARQPCVFYIFHEEKGTGFDYNAALSRMNLDAICKQELLLHPGCPNRQKVGFLRLPCPLATIIRQIMPQRSSAQRRMSSTVQGIFLGCCWAARLLHWPSSSSHSCHRN